MITPIRIAYANDELDDFLEFYAPEDAVDNEIELKMLFNGIKVEFAGHLKGTAALFVIKGGKDSADTEKTLPPTDNETPPDKIAA